MLSENTEYKAQHAIARRERSKHYHKEYDQGKITYNAIYTSGEKKRKY